MAKTHETIHEEDAAYDQQARHVMERVLSTSVLTRDASFTGC